MAKEENGDESQNKCCQMGEEQIRREEQMVRCFAAIAKGIMNSSIARPSRHAC